MCPKDADRSSTDKVYVQLSIARAKTKLPHKGGRPGDRIWMSSSRRVGLQATDREVTQLRHPGMPSPLQDRSRGYPAQATETIKIASSSSYPFLRLEDRLRCPSLVSNPPRCGSSASWAAGQRACASPLHLLAAVRVSCYVQNTSWCVLCKALLPVCRYQIYKLHCTSYQELPSNTTRAARLHGPVCWSVLPTENKPVL